MKRGEKVTPFKREIQDLKNDILDLESRFNFATKEIDAREARWKNCEKKMVELEKMNQGFCILNVGGIKFTVSLHVLKSRRGTLFYKQILRKEIKKDQEVFYDRDPMYFHVILNFLRTGKIDAKKYSEDQKEDLIHESQFFEVQFIVETLRATVAEVDFTKHEFSGAFMYEDKVVGTNIPKDLKDKTLQKGIVANTPGVITLTLSRDVEFQEIEIAGYNGNSTAWFVGHGRGAKILTSPDNSKWTEVGIIPPEFGHEIKKVPIKKTKAKYLRFSHTDFLGIGFLQVNDIEAKKKK
jgi:hypothetical protein